jgi:hypothetical protein
MTTTMRRKKTTRKKKKRETRLKAKMMKTTLPLTTPRRMRRYATLMRTRSPEMKPRSPPAG